MKSIQAAVTALDTVRQQARKGAVPFRGSGRRSDGTRSWALGSHCRELYGVVSAVSFYTEGRCAACICAVAGRSGQPRLAQTAGSPSGWRTSMLAKQRFDPGKKAKVGWA